MVIPRKPPGIAPMWVLTKYYEGVARPGDQGLRGRGRYQGVVRGDQEQYVIS